MSQQWSPLKGAIDGGKPLVEVILGESQWFDPGLVSAAGASSDPFVIFEPDVPTAVGKANHGAFISCAAALFLQVVFRFLQQLLNSLISHG